MRKPIAVVGLALFTFFPAVAAAQGMSPFSVEARAGVGFPTGDFGDEGAEMGVGFGVTGLFQATPLVGIYASWDRFAFGAEEDPEFPDVDAETIDSGFALGAQLLLATGAATGFGLFLRGGALYHKAEVKLEGDGNESFSLDSDYTLGFEVGGGVGVPLGQVLTFTPAVRYRAYSPEFEAFGETAEGDLTYVAVDFGLAYRF